MESARILSGRAISLLTVYALDLAYVGTRGQWWPDLRHPRNGGIGVCPVLRLTHQFNTPIALACPLGLLRFLGPNGNFSPDGSRRQSLGVFDAIGMGWQSCDLIVLDLEHFGGLRILGVRIDKGRISQRTPLPLSLWLLCQAVVGAGRSLSPSTSRGHGGAAGIGLIW